MMPTPTDTSPSIFYHGARADLKPRDPIAPGYSSNYGARKEGRGP